MLRCCFGAGLCPLGDYYGTSNDANYNIRFSITNDNSNPTGTARVWFNGHRSIAFVPDPSASASTQVSTAYIPAISTRYYYRLRDYSGWRGL